MAVAERNEKEGVGAEKMGIFLVRSEGIWIGRSWRFLLPLVSLSLLKHS